MINKLKKLIKASDVILFNDSGSFYGCKIKFINQHCFEVETEFFIETYKFSNVTCIDNGRIACFDEDDNQSNEIYFMKYLSA